MKNKGFTILEILVVISVIAILIGVAIPRFKGMQDEANIIKAKAQLRTMQAAMEAYKINYNLYPSTQTSLEGATPKIIDTGIVNPIIGSGSFDINTDGSIYYVISAKTSSSTASTINAAGAVTTNGSYCTSNGTGC